MNDINFNNRDLNFDIDKIKNFDTPIIISKEKDTNLETSFIINVQDNSYFYFEQKERDEDFEKLIYMIDSGNLNKTLHV